MNGERIVIDNLRISLVGVSLTVAEQAADGLELELHRRLAKLPGGYSFVSPGASMAVNPIRHSGTLDAASLRGLIIDRLIDSIISSGETSA